MTTERAGMLMPKRQGLGGEHHLHQALDEAGLDRLLERRDHAGVVSRHPGLDAGQPPVVAEHAEVAVGQVVDAGLDDGADASTFRGRW